MASYTIRVVNKTANDKNFFFFTAPPDVGTTADPNIYTNTWVATTGSQNEPIDVTTSLDFYGWCGPGYPQSGAKTVVSQGVSSGVAKLGVKGGNAGSTFLTQYSKANKHVKFGGLQVASAEAGCFEIETGNDFTSEDNLLIGMSMNDPSGGKYPVPVATISADPGMKYNIGPVVRFYVAVGSYSIGDVIDYQEISSTAGVYDFSPNGGGAGMTYGEIEYQTDGSWSVANYLPTPPRKSTVEAGWLQALIAFAQPILTQTLKDAIKAAITTCLSGLSYPIGPLTFSSDGTSISVSYRLPLTQEVVVKPFSEISVSLDAKNETLQITFSPAPSGDAKDLSAVGGPTDDLVKALTKAVMGVKGLPSGEGVKIS